MSYIRNKTEERTGYQNGGELTPEIDNRCDFVMVYRLNETTAQRIKAYKDAGYVVQFMTGISWGNYVDYLYGRYDGTNHWDEAQTDRNGNIISHGKDTPYMVPTVSFADYIAKSLYDVVDLGVVAIHVEEPEFWDRAGYSEAFKREYKNYYHENWTPPHESLDSHYKCAKLKSYLFTRTIDRVSASVKEYARRKYNRDIRFYVPTHSLLNYTQWKIVSPEGKLSDIPYVDGCIAQVWTGTAREKNWFDGIYKERTFETAYLEYGVMQELVKGTGRKMWFLHDPIEDNPIFDWNDYRTNYFCTVVASLLHPKVNTFEICPWPNRVFLEKYPKNPENGEPIPDDYATILNNTFNTLGTFEDIKEETGCKIGVLMSDSELFQREYPDCCFETPEEVETGTVIRDKEENIRRFSELFDKDNNDSELLLKYMSSSSFPGFYGITLPLLKYGIPVRPVLCDNARRFPSYLDDYDVLILSYDFMKPDYPDINSALAEWVGRGGTLIYIGDESDPYYKINSWWTGKFKTPTEHLFRMLGVDFGAEKSITKCRDGIVGYLKINPCKFTYSKENADIFRNFVSEVISEKGFKLNYKNNLYLERNEYIIAACLDESVNDEPLTIKGLFCDMFTPKFDIITEKVLSANDKCLLLNLDKITEENRILGTSVRVNSLTEENGEITLITEGSANFNANIRLRVSHPVSFAEADNETLDISYDELSKTALISFYSTQGGKIIKIK